MIHRIILAAGLTLAAFLGTSSASLRDEVEARAEAFMSANDIPGLQLGLWRSGQEQFVLEKGLGNFSPPTPTSRAASFRIGSITKSFTVMRILQLAAGGQVNLDAPVSTYLPDSLFSEPLKNNNATVRQLANMTSGINEYTSAPGFISTFVNNPFEVVSNAQIVNWANTNGPPLFPPGARWNYSNTNTILLGMLIEQVTNNDYGTEIADNVLTPAGLTHTLYPTTPSMPLPFNHGYNPDPDTNQLVDSSESFSPSYLSSAGALISTLDDLRVWGEFLTSGNLLPEPQRALLNAERFSFVPTEGDTHEYDAYGMGVGIVDGWIGHNGDLFGYQTVVLRDATHDQTLVISINLGGADHNMPTRFFSDQLSQLLAIPEPSSWALIGIGAAAVIVRFALAGRPQWP